MERLSSVFTVAFLEMLARLAGWLPWLLLVMLLLFLYRLPSIRMARRRRRLIQRLEERRGSRVIAMIHRGGGPLALIRGGGSIGLFESETILKIIRETPPERPIDLLLHTPGGLILSSAQIARALKNHPAPVRVIVPHWAMSGGTFLSLAADEIIMDRNAVLGPVDPQTVSLKGQVAMASVLRVVREKSRDEIEDETWILVDQAEKILREMEQHLCDLMEERLGAEKAREIARTMTQGRWTHGYPLTWEALRDMGLKVSTDVPEEAYQLLELFPAGGRFRPVQWLPGRKRAAEPDGIQGASVSSSRLPSGS
ncbi:MAG: SDH family Clp fold serine proteinase [Bacillota bacterium]